MSRPSERRWQAGEALRPRLTYANVMSTIAVFGVLAGGGAYAASQIGTNDIKNNAVTYKQLACKGNSAQDRMVRAGAVCIDKFEASVWSKPNGGIQYGVSGDDYPCHDNGQTCKGEIFARSVKGVAPSRYITWFQAEAALSNSGKRLPQSNEWQKAVQGTPSGAPCVVTGSGPEITGSAGCKSAYGAHDMVGNLREWVADWGPASTTCPGWGSFSNDSMCLSGASAVEQGPGALFRGGAWFDGTAAGPFAVDARDQPSDSFGGLGFRGAR